MNTKHTSLPLPFGKAWPWVTFVAGLFLVNYMARSTLSPLMVAVEEHFHASHAEATSLLLMQGIGFTLTQAAAGFLVGRISPARVAVACNMAAGFCLMSLYFVDSLFQARIVFFFLGISAGFYFPAGMAILGSLVNTKDWGKTVAIHEIAPNASFICVPLLVQMSLMFTTWRGAFVVMGIICVGMGVLFLLFGLGGHTPTARPSFAGNASILRNRNTWIFSLLIGIGMCGEFSVYSVLQIFLVHEGGLNPTEANTWLSLSRLCAPLAVIIGGWSVDKYPSERVMIIGLILHAASLCIMSATSGIVMLIAVCTQAASIAMYFPSVFKLMTERTPLSQQPILLSLSMPPAALTSAAILPWFFGLCGDYASFAIGFYTLACITLLGILSLKFLHSSEVSK